MKNAIYILIIVACIGLIAFGLMREDKPKATTEATAVEQQNNAGETGNVKAATSTPKAIGQNVQHFRPDATVTVEESSNSSATGENSAPEFRVTPELLAKMYLVDTYKPGICYGAPVSVSQSSIEYSVTQDPQLSNYLKIKYSLKTDQEIYNKLKQLYGVSLVETASSKYSFTFLDGQCQNTTYYAGVVTVSGNIVTSIVSEQTGHAYQ